MKECLTGFAEQVQKLHSRHALAETVGADYYEPGQMEYLEQSDGCFDEVSGEFTIRFEARGTRYDGRTEQIEHCAEGDAIQVVRDRENPFNSNNFALLNRRGKNVGNMPAELCNAIAPLFDGGTLTIRSASVSFVDPISRRSRYAKQSVLFVEMKGKIE